MKRLVIANRGCGGLGKSSAVRSLFYLLKREGYELEQEEWQGWEEYGDIKAIFLINGVKVGIESQGDPDSKMEGTIDEFIERGCEIIVTACRTKGSTFIKVRDYLGKELGFDIIWSAHDVFPGQTDQNILNKLNDNYAQRVKGIIDGRIKGVL
jgi:hypothetical protein